MTRGSGNISDNDLSELLTTTGKILLKSIDSL